MKKRKSLFWVLCLAVMSLCLFVACGGEGAKPNKGESSSPSAEEVLPEDPSTDDSSSGETPKDEGSTDSGIQFPEVSLP